MKKYGHFGYFWGSEVFQCGSASAWPAHPHQLQPHIKAGGGEESGAKVTGLPPTTTLLSITSTDKDMTPLRGTEMGDIRVPACPQTALCAERENKTAQHIFILQQALGGKIGARVQCW